MTGLINVKNFYHCTLAGLVVFIREFLPPQEERRALMIIAEQNIAKFIGNCCTNTP